MHILQLPLEILYQIVEKLDNEDLWSLHSCSVALQVVSAPYLFRNVEIRFNRDLPEFVNSRPMSPRLREALTRWSFHVKILEIWADEDPMEPQFFGLLTCFHNLRTIRICYPPAVASLRQLLAHIACLSSVNTLSIDFMSPRTWNGTLNFDNLRNLCLSCVQHEPGLCVLPSLPLLETLSLNFCCYCLECPKNGCGPCTKIQFDELPRLVHLSISGAQTSNVVCSGTAHRLSKLHIDDSDGLILSTVLVCVGVQLEEISIWNCDFEIDASVSLVAKSGLKSVRIFDSRSSLCLLHLAEISSTACFDIRIHPNDFERLEDWPRIMRLLRIHRVTVTCTITMPTPDSSRIFSQTLTPILVYI